MCINFFLPLRQDPHLWHNLCSIFLLSFNVGSGTNERDSIAPELKTISGLLNFIKTGKTFEMQYSKGLQPFLVFKWSEKTGNFTRSFNQLLSNNCTL